MQSSETVCCPICQGLLKVIGSRRRGVITPESERITLNIRRLRCEQCHKIHHELPDLLIPYRRHCLETIAAICEEEDTTVCCDDCTIYRVRAHFRPALIALLLASTQLDSAFVRFLLLSFDGIGAFPINWMSHCCRMLVNANLWFRARATAV